MGTLALSLPTVGSPNSTEEPKIPAALSAIQADYNGNIDNSNVKSTAAIAHSKLASGSSAQLILCNASGVPTATTMSGDVTISNTGVTTVGASKITDAKMAAPNNSVYRSILEADCRVVRAADYMVAGTYYFGFGGDVLFASAVNGPPNPAFIRLDSADFAVATLTTKLRLKAQLHTGTNSAAITYTFGLYPVTAIAAAVHTIGAVVAGSTSTITNPAVNSMNTSVGAADFTIPANGTYLPGFTTSGTASTQYALAYCQLQMRNV